MTLDYVTVPIGEALRVYSYRASFAKGMAKLRQEGLDLITARELAEVRTLSNGLLCHEVAIVGESYTYLPNGDIMIAARELSPLIKRADSAMREHYEDEEFYLDKRAIRRLMDRAETGLEKAISTGVLYLPRKEVKREFPVAAICEETVPLFLLRDYAMKYQEFLAGKKVESVQHSVLGAHYAKRQKKPFTRPLKLGSVFGWSTSFDGDSDLGSHVCTTMAVRRVNAPEPDIRKALEEGDEFRYNGLLYVPVRDEPRTS